jgi:alpha-N-arabinofuranosidase
LPPGERVPYVIKTPGRANPPDEPSSAAARQGRLALPVPLSGNFTLTDNFDQPALSPLWLMLRAPKETWWQLADGKLTLTPRADRLSGIGNPSFYGRRLQHSKFEASTQLQVPATAGTSAGLVAIQNETHHFYFAVQRTAGGLSLFLEKWNGPKSEIVSTALLPADTQLIELRLTGDEKILSFDYAVQPGAWKSFVAKTDSYPISVQAAGGGMHFTGALVGVHARLEQ